MSELTALWFQSLYDTPLLFSGILDGEGRVIDANRTAIEGCGLDRAATLGQPFWACGWWSPDSSVSERVQHWVEQALTTGDSLRVRSSYFRGDGSRRAVDMCLTPIHDSQTDADYVVATGLDITDTEAAQAAGMQRMIDEADALVAAAAAHEQTLLVTQEAEKRAERSLRRLADVALELVDAKTVADVTTAVVDHGLTVLGADGGSVVVREPDGQLRVSISNQLGLPPEFSSVQLDPDSALPGPAVMRTGQRIIITDHEAGIAFSEEIAQLYRATAREALVTVPLRVGEEILGALSVTWPTARDFSADELALVDAFAALTAQALERIAANRVQQESIFKVRQLAESLQRSMLTRPQTPRGLTISVRYKPAAAEAQIGGDWYDVFSTSAAATMLVVGDVAGHDQIAAAAMGQLRNLLRGMSYDSDAPPGDLLSSLDLALQGLEVNTLATALLARVEAVADGTARRRMTWSSAGHLPPILREPDGAVRMLETSPELLLGLQADATRSDHVVELQRGSTLLMFTDGLVERRGVHLDRGMAWLTKLVTAIGALEPELICAAILASVNDSAIDDDVALLVMRCD
jgi:PAS domain S-box-containing protein